MGLQQRLTLFTVSLVTILSAILGGSLIQSDFNAAISSVRSDLTSIKNAVDTSASDKITTALSLSQSSRASIAILLQDESGEIAEISSPFTDYPLEEIARSSSELKNQVGLIDGFLFTSVEIEGDAALILIAPATRYIDQRNRNVIFLLLFLIAIIFVALLLLRMVIARDVAREREAIESAERLKSEARQKVALLDFAGDASHELRTPLTVLKGYLELAAQSKIDLNDKATLDRLLKESKRMEETISHLLEVFESEALPSEKEELVDLSRVLIEAVSSFKDINPKRPVVTEIEPGLILKADSELLLRVFNNALMNIYRHTGPADRVLIRAFKENGAVSIEFHDAGPGFPNGDYLKKARLFTRFDPSRSRATGGSGLGLSIIKSATEKLGGSLRLDRSDLGGALLKIKLPLSEASKNSESSPC